MRTTSIGTAPPQAAIEDLESIPREGADADGNGDLLDAGFGDLGGDSPASPETAVRITGEHGLAFDDEAATAAATPRVPPEALTGG